MSNKPGYGSHLFLVECDDGETYVSNGFWLQPLSETSKTPTYEASKLEDARRGAALHDRGQDRFGNKILASDDSDIVVLVGRDLYHALRMRDASRVRGTGATALLCIEYANADPAYLMPMEDQGGAITALLRIEGSRDAD